MNRVETELLPCPMCGFTGHLRFEFRFATQKHFFIECQDVDCLTKGPEHLTKAEAIASWNRRTPIAAGGGEALTSVAQQTFAAIALAKQRGSSGELTSEDFAVAAHGSLLWRAWVDAGIVLAALSTEPAYWAVFSKSDTHIGLWPNKAIAEDILREYPGGSIVPLFTKEKRS